MFKQLGDEPIESLMESWDKGKTEKENPEGNKPETPKSREGTQIYWRKSRAQHNLQQCLKGHCTHRIPKKDFPILGK